jgi:amidase
VFGLKSTWGLIPTFGHIPPPPALRTSAPMDLSVAGPIARSAGDLDLALSIVAGPINAAGPAFLKRPRAITPKGLRIALWMFEGAVFDGRVIAAVETAAAALSDGGALIDRAARPDFTFAEVFETYSLLLNAIMAQGFTHAQRDRIAARAADYAPNDVSHRALQARAARMSENVFGELMRKRRVMRAQLSEFFTRYDAILMPVTPAPAIRHDHSKDFFARRIAIDNGEIDYSDMLFGAALATVLNAPAVSAPVLRAAGPGAPPVGVQIVCAEDEDRTAIAIAAMLEQAIGGFVPPVLTQQI